MPRTRRGARDWPAAVARRRSGSSRRGFMFDVYGAAARGVNARATLETKSRLKPAPTRPMVPEPASAGFFVSNVARVFRPAGNQDFNRIHFPAMLDASALPQIRFARAKKARRAQKAEEPPAAATVETPGRISPGLRLVLASLAVVLLFFGQRLQNPQPWSYDEYYHLGLARVMLSSGLRMESFRWTPFSITHDHFADASPCSVLPPPLRPSAVEDCRMLVACSADLPGRLVRGGLMARARAAPLVVRARARRARHPVRPADGDVPPARLADRLHGAGGGPAGGAAVEGAVRGLRALRPDARGSVDRDPVGDPWALRSDSQRGRRRGRIPGNRWPRRRAAALGHSSSDVPENPRSDTNLYQFQAATASNAALHSDRDGASPPGSTLLGSGRRHSPGLIAIALLSRPQCHPGAIHRGDPPFLLAGRFRSAGSWSGSAAAMLAWRCGAGVAGSQTAADRFRLGRLLADGARPGILWRSSACEPTAVRRIGAARDGAWLASTERTGSASHAPVGARPAVIFSAKLQSWWPRRPLLSQDPTLRGHRDRVRERTRSRRTIASGWARWVTIPRPLSPGLTARPDARSQALTATKLLGLDSGTLS